MAGRKRSCWFYKNGGFIDYYRELPVERIKFSAPGLNALVYEEFSKGYGISMLIKCRYNFLY